MPTAEPTPDPASPDPVTPNPAAAPGPASSFRPPHHTRAGGFRALPGAQVSERAAVGDGSTVWELAQVREGAELGTECVVGRGAYVGAGVRIGDRCKLQNHALVYEPAVLGDGVFVGPAVVLTNDRAPRAVEPDGALKRAGDWEAVGVTVADGASLGARAVCVAPVRIGRWAMVAAGAVVTADVPDFGLVAGVPARRIGWVGRAGVRLRPVPERPGEWECPSTGERYREQTEEDAAGAAGSGPGLREVRPVEHGAGVRGRS
ncbi:Hexapeptide repeat of succinyl-transferase [Streptomyces qinglanensis]|uniref:Hexapeptide repeat of succinyl-transferase n=1 Tax=Streptomyces qinglanensis TaxID=943816 RepID=A0A1H9WVI0_9ACTN|nr:Hexapeptide repeat of succinyl-transferase [Streptomyces qinglanensis]